MRKVFLPWRRCLAAAVALFVLAGCGGGADVSQSDPVSDGASVSDGAADLSQDVSAAPKIDYTGFALEDALGPMPEEGAGEVAALLSEIDRTPYGTAGAYLTQCISAIDVLRLVQLTGGGESLAEVEAYLSSLSPMELDYFSFVWQHSVGFARAIAIDPGAYTDDLASCGKEDFPFTEEMFEQCWNLSEAVKEKMEALGCDYSWQNFIDLEPFCQA